MSLSKQTLLLSSALALAAAACGSQSTPPSSTPESVANESSTEAGANETSSTTEMSASPTASSQPALAGSSDSSATGGASTPTSTTGMASSSDTAAEARSPTAGATSTLTDQQIAKITDSVNSAEIEQARLAQQKSRNERVRQFASMMIEHHGQAKQQQSALKLTPQDSPLAQQLAAESQSTLETLKAKTGVEFDRAYMQAQVEGHQKVLDTLKRELRPSAQSPELQAYLQNLEPRVAEHLSQAEKAQQALQSSTETKRGTGTASAR